MLERAFPSPFQSQTTILYRLGETMPIHLSIYDALGREVRVLASGVQSAGVHRVNFHAEDLPNGVYFYRLTTETSSQSYPVVLTR